MKPRRTDPAPAPPLIVRVLAIGCLCAALRAAIAHFLPPWAWSTGLYQLVFMPLTDWPLVIPIPGETALDAWILLRDTRSAAPIGLVIGAIALNAALGHGLWHQHRWARAAALVLVPAALGLAVVTTMHAPALAPPSGETRPFFDGASLLSRLLFAAGLLPVLASNRARDDLRPHEASGTAQNGGARPPRDLPALVAACCAVLVAGAMGLVWLALAWRPGGIASPGDAALFAWPLFGLVVSWRLARRGPQPWALGASTAWLLANAVFVLLTLGRGALWLFYVPALSPVLLAAAAAALAGMAAALAASWRLPKRAVLRAGTWALGFFLPVAVLTECAVIGRRTESNSWRWRSVREARENQRRWERHEEVTARVRALARCAFRYAETHPGAGFPGSAEQMGPQGTACLPLEALPAENGAPRGDPTMRIRYEARLRPPAERAEGFVASGYLVDPARGPELPELAIDETGVSRMGRPAVDIMASHLQFLAKRIEFQRAPGGPTDYPPDLSSLVKADRAKDPWSGATRLTSWPADVPVRERGYVFVYSPKRGSGGQVLGYTLSARPAVWGEREFRSYLIRDDGRLHATPFDRPATVDDPVVPPQP